MATATLLPPSAPSAQHLLPAPAAKRPPIWPAPDANGIIHIPGPRGRMLSRYLLAPQLKAWRRAAGLSRLDLALAANIGDPRMYLQLERGERLATMDQLTGLADALGITNWMLAQDMPDNYGPVVPTVRVQAVEYPSPAGDGTIELAFYLHRLWAHLPGCGRRELDEVGLCNLLADHLGVSRQQLVAILQVEEPAPLPLITQLAKALRCTVMELITY